jgi:hypothetical protein
MFKEKKEQIVKVSYEGGTQSFLNNASKALRVSLRLRGVGPDAGRRKACPRSNISGYSDAWLEQLAFVGFVCPSGQFVRELP